MLQEKLRQNLYLLLFVILSTTVRSQPEDLNWEWVHPLPTGNELYSVKMLDEKTAVVVGGAGTFMKTTNAGNYWDIQYNVADIMFLANDVSFADENIGFLVGQPDAHADRYVIARTDDGGQTWARQQIDHLEPDALRGVHFLDAQTGYVAGREGRVFKTTNSGETWVDKSTGYTGTDLNKVYFASSKTGWVVGDWGTIFKTTNGGDSWQLQYATDNNTFLSVNFLDSLTGYVGGFGVYKTTNGGENWARTTTSPIVGGRVRGLKFLNPDFGFAVGNGRVARTTDGGDTWEIVHEDHTYIQFYSVSFFDNLNGFVVGSRGEILRTNDGGLSWTRLTQSSIPPAALRIDDVYFLDNLNGIAAGEGEGGGVIYRTSDGGINWSLKDVGATPIFRRIGFFDENTGVAVGRYGIIRRTNNRGETWANPQLNQATSQLFDVHIVDDAFGCAVGETNIVTTTDAGLTWQKQDYTGSWLFGVHFLNREKGFAVGNGGRVYGTVDGGATWDHVATIEPPRILRRVTFADSLNGVVVGDLGTVGRTTDGGLTWSGVELPEPYENSLFAVSFINSTTGYAGGLGGIILKTTDKGATWVRKNSKTHQSILGMHFLSETQGAMTGTFGQLLRTESLNTPVFHTNKSTVTFDDVQIGTMEQRNVIIYNLGNALLSIESIFATDTNFSVSHNSAAIFPGDSISLIIEFSPSETGLYELDVIFEHNSISSPDTVKIIADAITSVAGEKNNLPREFKLYQNYPNPFNPSTSIKFDIPHYAMVEISVYTILGQKIAVLLNKELAAGYHSVVWDASKLSSGIYLFHLKADNQTFVKKAILLK